MIPNDQDNSDKTDSWLQLLLIEGNLLKQGKYNKALAQRLRVSSIELAILDKVFRRASVQHEKTLHKDYKEPVKKTKVAKVKPVKKTEKKVKAVKKAK